LRLESGEKSERTLGQQPAAPDHQATGGAPNGIGGLDDNLPFEATAEQLGSIALHTWIYTDTGPSRTRLGYLRSGAIVERRGPAIENDGCKGGWYRVNPRGFVCVGKGATLDLNHPVLRAAKQGPIRGEGFPYTYALAGEQAPYLYFKLPSSTQMREIEGEYQSRAARFLWGTRNNPELSWLNIESQPPEFVQQGQTLTKPYGSEAGLRREVHAGQAARDSGFALTETFEWENRAFGLTTELDMIALDRIDPVKQHPFQGVVLGTNEELPALRVTAHWVNVYPVDAEGKTGKPHALPRRSIIKLSGNKRVIGGVAHWETTEGAVIPGVGVEIIKARTSFPSVATGDRKWIDVSLKDQVLVAYEGRKPVYVTLVSTGAAGLADPEKTTATVQGTFMIYAKHVSATMNGDEDKADSFSLRDVPFVQYFHKGYALHGAYWHDEFGRWRSHGCVNLSGRDSAWLFEWTDPPVPKDWHMVLNKERGTVVVISP
jgi:lipoprotein-anchoring transpeptidase ErfK/SrfK